MITHTLYYIDDFVLPLVMVLVAVVTLSTTDGEQTKLVLVTVSMTDEATLVGIGMGVVEMAGQFCALPLTTSCIRSSLDRDRIETHSFIEISYAQYGSRASKHDLIIHYHIRHGLGWHVSYYLQSLCWLQSDIDTAYKPSCVLMYMIA